jgi:predicted Zn-dependent protease with MMP-like domain
LEASFTANVLECKPAWYINEADTMNYHAPTGTITIAVPSSLSSTAVVAAVEAAAEDWETALNRTIDVVLNTLCNSTDERCIELKADYGTLEQDGAGCGQFNGTSPDANGAWELGNSLIRFRSTALNSQNTHPDYLRRTMAHEIGHYFGLQNREDPSCVPTISIMATGGQCGNPDAPDSDYKLGPTASDISPLLESTYGNQIRATCGW